MNRPNRLSRFVLTLSAPATLLLACGTTPAQPTSASASASKQPADRMADVSEDVRTQIAKARDAVFPALVHIEVVFVNHYGGKEVKNRASGSGTIISPEGYVLTNAHVTNDGVKFWCTLSDKRRIPATLVGEDPFTDLAVLQIDKKEAFAPGSPTAVATFGDSDALNVGDYVLAMGSPFSLSRTVTLGVVSNNERVFTSGAGDIDTMTIDGSQRTGIFTNWIQHDALINPGNSGGPLVSLKGQIIGVNTRGGSGLSFATPSNLARAVAESLIKNGEVVRSSLGISFRQIEETGFDHGVFVDSVEKDGPAAEAGIEAGDLILSINGEPVTVRFPEQIPPLLKQMAELPVGSKVEATYERRGAAGKATITTKKLLKEKADEESLRDWGMTAKKINERMARYLRLDSTDGVYVDSTRSGSVAQMAEPAIEGGDIIREIDGKPMKTLSDVIEYYKSIAAMEKPPEYVLVQYERQGKNYVTLMKSRPDKPQDPVRELPKAWIGVATQPFLQRIADKMGAGYEPGFRVTRVYPGTRAAEAGIKVGDLIVGINKDKLRPRGMQEAGAFTRAVKNVPIDDTAEISIIRDGTAMKIPVVMEKSRTTPEEARRDRNQDFEMTVREITFFDRDDNRWDQSVSGVIIDSADSAGWAGLGGLRGGDLIQRIDDYKIESLEDYRKAMTEITKAKPKRVVFVVLRGLATSFRFIEPAWGAEEKPDDAPAAPSK
ncbi:MAG: PDZ domain-containing protein [Phycisphaerales bacterium]